MHSTNRCNLSSTRSSCRGSGVGKRAAGVHSAAYHDDTYELQPREDDADEPGILDRPRPTSRGRQMSTGWLRSFPATARRASLICTTLWSSARRSDATTIDADGPPALIDLRPRRRFTASWKERPPSKMRAGQVVLSPRTDVRTLAMRFEVSRLSTRTISIQPSAGQLAQISHGGGGETTHLVCGFQQRGSLQSPDRRPAENAQT